MVRGTVTQRQSAVLLRRETPVRVGSVPSTSIKLIKKKKHLKIYAVEPVKLGGGGSNPPLAVWRGWC